MMISPHTMPISAHNGRNRVQNSLMPPSNLPHAPARKSTIVHLASSDG